MTTSLEFEGKNVEKALDQACVELKIPRDRLKYEILSYGSSGIFGLAGTKKARIRVNLAQESPESVAETSILEKSAEIGDDMSETKVVVGEDSDDRNQIGEPQLHTFPDNPSDLGRSVLQRIVDAITTNAKITVEEDSDRISFNVAGGNAAVLIGKRGQTLEAIQSLVEKVVNKHNHNRIRIRVDIEGYLENRRANLEKMAIRLAEKTIRIGKPISLEQMSAHDRRIIHMTLKDHSDVGTQSKGEGYLRKLLIFPKKNSVVKGNIQGTRS